MAMSRITRSLPAALLVVSALILAGCGSSTGSTGTSETTQTTPSATPGASSPAPVGSPSPSLSSSEDPGVATALDPCDLVTQDEASTLAGTTYAKGVEETSGKVGKRCVYGSQTRNVFTVELGQAADPAKAQAEFDAAQAQAQALVKGKLPPGVQATLDNQSVAGLADRAATLSGKASIAGVQLGFSGIYVLQGPVFFAFQDLVQGKAAPSPADMKAQAQVVLGRIS